MPRNIILHSDLNCFYASVEINENPSLRNKAIAVCGSTENRHGIVLTASYPAKRRGVKTGMANWEARQACPGLICVDPHYELYLKYSRLVRRIYARYSDTIEPFGMDENWISIPYCKGVAETGLEVAEEIRRTVREEIGLTVSIGVSFSKIYAKLGSDMKKPDAVTVAKGNTTRPAAGHVHVGKGSGNICSGAAGFVAIADDQKKAPVAAVGEGRCDRRGTVCDAGEHLRDGGVEGGDCVGCGRRTVRGASV